jgi:hypothetical protein
VPWRDTGGLAAVEAICLPPEQLVPRGSRADLYRHQRGDRSQWAPAFRRPRPGSSDRQAEVVRLSLLALMALQSSEDPSSSLTVRCLAVAFSGSCVLWQLRARCETSAAGSQL